MRAIAAFAFAAIFFALMKGFCGKKISDYTAHPSDAAYYNTIRMFIKILQLEKRSMDMESYEFLLFLAVIMISTKVFGLFSRKIHMPAVVGALAAGVILGDANKGTITIRVPVATIQLV